MSFSLTQKVMFKHCDPAGIVFYPRYFEMINDAVEVLFSEELFIPIETILQTAGIPTVQINATFAAPSFHGDVLKIVVTGNRLGESSFDLSFIFSCNDQTRLEASSTLVYVNEVGRSQHWPESMRTKLDHFIGAKNDA